MKCQKCKETCLHRAPTARGEQDTRCFDSHFERYLDPDNTRCCICAYSHMHGILRLLCPRCQERMKCNKFKKNWLSSKCQHCKRKEDEHLTVKEFADRMTPMGFGIPVTKEKMTGVSTADQQSQKSFTPQPPHLQQQQQQQFAVDVAQQSAAASNIPADSAPAFSDDFHAQAQQSGGGFMQPGQGPGGGPGGGPGVMANGMAGIMIPPAMTPRDDGTGGSTPPANAAAAAAAAAALSQPSQAPIRAAGAGRDLLNEIPQWEIQPHELMISSHKLGTGNFGAVYRGLFNGAVVAIKTPFSQQPKPHDMATIRREVAMLNQIRHPNCVAFYGACLVPGKMAIVTEYVQRGNLHDLIARKRLPPALRIRMARDTASGMLYLHRRAIIHRDLKSLNLLVAEDYTIRVADFGLAVLKNSGTSQMVGTPSWMAPELFQGSAGDERSDVYAFGMVMWELLTCQKPHVGFEPRGVQQFVLGGHRPPVPNPLPEGFTLEFWTLMMLCWDQSPEKRPLFHDILPPLERMLHVASQDQQHLQHASSASAASGGVQSRNNTVQIQVVSNLTQSQAHPAGLPSVMSNTAQLNIQSHHAPQAPPPQGQYQQQTAQAQAQAQALLQRRPSKPTPYAPGPMAGPMSQPMQQNVTNMVPRIR